MTTIETFCSREEAIAAAVQAYDSGRFFADLDRRVGYHTESQEPAQAPQLHAYLTEEIAPTLHRMGFETKMVQNPEDVDAPVLLAVRNEGDDLPTVVTTGIAPFERLVDQVMSQPPYSTARRVFWVMDNGSSHRGQASVHRLTQTHPRLVPVHGPVHASWLNQIDIYFSIVQRKVLTPNDFPSLTGVAQRLANFERYYETIAHPFEWKFTRADLNALIARMRDRWARTQSWKLTA